MWAYLKSLRSRGRRISHGRTRKDTEIGRSRDTEGKPSMDPRIREDDKSAVQVRPFDKLRDRLVEASARHSRECGNPEIYAAKHGSPHSRG